MLGQRYKLHNSA